MAGPLQGYTPLPPPHPLVPPPPSPWGDLVTWCGLMAPDLSDDAERIALHRDRAEAKRLLAELLRRALRSE